MVPAMQDTPSGLEFPKQSGVTIRVVANRTTGEAYGQGWLVMLPGKVTGNGRERKQFKTLQAAKDFASASVAGLRAIGGKFIDLEHADRAATLRLLDAIKERSGGAGAQENVVDDVIASLKAIGASQLRLNPILGAMRQLVCHAISRGWLLGCNKCRAETRVMTALRKALAELADVTCLPQRNRKNWELRRIQNKASALRRRFRLVLLVQSFPSLPWITKAASVRNARGFLSQIAGNGFPIDCSPWCGSADYPW